MPMNAFQFIQGIEETLVILEVGGSVNIESRQIMPESSINI